MAGIEVTRNEERRHVAKRKLLGSHNRSWIWGRNVVQETLRAGRWPIVELLLGERLDPDVRQWAQQTAWAAGTPVSVEPDQVLTERSRAEDHQGWLARMGPFPYTPFDELCRTLPASPLLLILDRIQDSFNLGAVIRAAEVLGVDGLLLEQSGQAGVNSQVARSSAGSVNFVPIARVERLVDAAASWRDRGIALVGACETSERPLFDCDFRPPTAVIIGNETGGIRPELLHLCAGQVRIPQQGRIGSLNAAVSAGILLYEVRRQRWQAERLADGGT